MGDGLIDLKVHFGGRWVKHRNSQMSLYDYVNGMVGDVLQVDLDRIGYFALLENARKLSGCPIATTYSMNYLNDYGILVDVKDDKDTMSMLDCMIRRKGVGHIFFDWEHIASVNDGEAGPSTQCPHFETKRKVYDEYLSYMNDDFSDAVNDNMNGSMNADLNAAVYDDIFKGKDIALYDDFSKGKFVDMNGSNDSKSWNEEDELCTLPSDSDSCVNDYKHCQLDGDDDNVAMGDGNADGEEDEDLYAHGDFPGEDRSLEDASLLKLYVGKRFKDVGEYRDHLRMHAVQHHYEYILVKNEKTRVTAKCKDDHCKWRCHGSPIDGLTYEIRTMNPQHTCVSRVQSTNCVARSLFVTKYIVEKMRKRVKKYNPSDIIDDIHEQFQIFISYDIAWYSRLKAMEILYGSYDVSYSDTPEVCRQILLSNPRNRAKWHKEVDGTFSWIYVSYHVMLEQWRHNCRPVVGLDGCFLKGKYGGACLAATGLDGNRGLYPLAIFVCKSEDKKTWKAFLEELVHVLCHNQRLTFYSDRQKGLLDAVTEVFPNAGHRYCMRHIYANFKLQFKGKLLKDTVWEAASTYEFCVWQEAMMKLKQLCPPAYEYMASIKPIHWARSHFDWMSACGHLTNNFSESFNNMIKKIRDLPVTQFIEKLNIKMIELINRRSKNTLKMSGPLTKNMTKEMKIKANRLRLLVPQNTSDRLVMVMLGEERKWEVDIVARTCTCTEWQISGIPCAHAMCALFNRRMDPNEFLHKYYHVETYKSLYNKNVRMIADRKNWVKGNEMVLPPKVKRAPGRPKTSRIREEDESTTGLVGHRCGVCGQFGHNQRRCPKGPYGTLMSNPTNPRSKRGRGGSSRGGVSYTTSVQEDGIPTTVGGVSTRGRVGVAGRGAVVGTTTMQGGVSHTASMQEGGIAAASGGVSTMGGGVSARGRAGVAGRRGGGASTRGRGGVAGRSDGGTTTRRVNTGIGFAAWFDSQGGSAPIPTQNNVGGGGSGGDVAAATRGGNVASTRERGGVADGNGSQVFHTA